VTATPKGEKKPTSRPALYIASITMADGSDINGPAAQERIARALLALARTPKGEAAHAAD
jgi:hypothetical protein